MVVLGTWPLGLALPWVTEVCAVTPASGDPGPLVRGFGRMALKPVCCLLQH